MSIFQLTPYRIPLRQPLLLAGGVRLTHREGLLLHDPESGGWGDAAPLPGFSSESLSEVLAAANAADFETHPSLRFAAECARQPVRGLEHPVRVNFLWIPDQEPLEALLTRLHECSSPCVKVKPGPRPDLSALRELTARLPGVRLRLDANRQWDVETTLRVIESLPPASLEYVEEPLGRPDMYEPLWGRHPVPVALDESLRLPAEGDDLARDPRVVALVLKPTLLGNSVDCARWTRLGKPVVWSSSFESGVGLWRLAERAAELSTPCGLDTARVFARDVADPSPVPVRGEIPAGVWKVVPA